MLLIFILTNMVLLVSLVVFLGSLLGSVFSLYCIRMGKYENYGGTHIALIIFMLSMIIVFFTTVLGLMKCYLHHRSRPQSYNFWVQL